MLTQFFLGKITASYHEVRKVGISTSYSVAFNDQAGNSAVDFLNITISNTGSTVKTFKTSSIEEIILLVGKFGNFDSTKNFAYIDAKEMKEAEIQDILDGYLTDEGWYLNPKESIDGFMPDMNEQIENVFSMFVFLRFDDSTSPLDINEVTILTERSALASAVVPEPLTILGTATAVGFGAFFKRQINKKKKDK